MPNWTGFFKRLCGRTRKVVVDRSTVVAAGNYVVWYLVRCVADQSHRDAVDSLLRQLEPRHFEPTESILIFAAAKVPWEAGKPLNLDAVEEALDDPAGFVRYTLHHLAETTTPGIRNCTVKMNDAIRCILEFEEIQKQRVANIARAIIDNEIGPIEGARKLLAHDEFCIVREPQESYAIFSDVCTRAQSFPEGPSRRHWNPTVLSELDRQRAALVASVLSDVQRACRELIVQLQS